MCLYLAEANAMDSPALDLSRYIFTSPIRPSLGVLAPKPPIRNKKIHSPTPIAESPVDGKIPEHLSYWRKSKFRIGPDCTSSCSCLERRLEQGVKSARTLTKGSGHDTSTSLHRAHCPIEKHNHARCTKTRVEHETCLTGAPPQFFPPHTLTGNDPLFSKFCRKTPISMP